MENNFPFLFVLCTFLNVVISTAKSVMTIKGSKLSAALWNALGYGLYAYIIVMIANSQISMLYKIGVTVVSNLIGVYIVKWLEEKLRKDRPWKIELTVLADRQEEVIYELKEEGIPFNYIENIGKYTIFNVYAATKEETRKIQSLSKQVKAQIFATETKLVS